MTTTSTRTPSAALRIRDWWASVGVRDVRRLLILPVLVSFFMLWPALLNQGVLAPTDIIAYDPLTGGYPPGAPRPVAENPVLTDPADSIIPWRLYARSELEAGRFPLWNPYNLLGTHLHANLQSQIFNPYTLLWFLLPSLWGLGAIVALKWTIGALGMGLLIRKLGMGMAPAIFASLAFQLSGPVVGWLQWSIADGLLWVPWLLWATLGWFDNRKPGWLAALTFLVAAELLASHIETSFHALTFMGVFAVAAWLAARWQRGRERWLVMAGVVGASALGLALAAVQLLPFLDVLTSSYQWALRQVTQIGQAAQPRSSWLLWLNPNLYGWPDAYLGDSNWVEANPYVGALTLLLAAWLVAIEILGVVRGRLPAPAPPTTDEWLSAPPELRKPRFDWHVQFSWGAFFAAISPRKTLFWVVIFAVAVSMAFGVPPLSYLRSLPGFSSSINMRLISVAGVCLIVLGAMGLERLFAVGRAVLSRRWGYVLGVFAFAAVPFFLLGLNVWTFKSDPVAAYVRSWKMWAVALFCIGAVLILARLLGWLKPRTLGVLAVGLLLIDMFPAAFNFNPTATFATFYPPNTVTDFLASHGPTERVAVEGNYATADALLPYKIPDFRSYDATENNRYLKFTELLSPATFLERNSAYRTHLILEEPNAVIGAAVGIKWVVAPVNEDPTGWQPVPDTGPIYNLRLVSNDFWVWENMYARPYAYLANRIQVAPDEATEYRRMRALTLDRIDQVHVEDSTAAFPRGVESSDTGVPISDAEAQSVKVVNHVPGEIVVQVHTESTRLLVVNEGLADGWRAYVDGAPAAIFRANYVVQSVVVPPGSHTVRLAYEPKAFTVGVLISLVALFAWVGLIGFSIWSAARLRRKRTVEQSVEER